MLSHISFGEGKKTLAILIPTPDLNRDLLLKHYVRPLENLGVPPTEIIAFNLEQNDQGKSPVAIIRPCLAKLEKIVKNQGIRDVLICDSDYFKTLCKIRKTSPYYGYPIKTTWSNVTGFVCSNYRSLFFNPAAQSKIAFSLQAAVKHMHNKGGMFDEQILTKCSYPTTEKEIIQTLESYQHKPAITCDIETYSLKLDKAGLATISFAEDKHTGFAFSIGDNRTIRHYLKEFLTNYQGTLIFHGSPYDCKILIWELFMEHPKDYQGMLEGLHILFRDLQDTKILAYLALNTTANLSLKLKDLAFQYTGNYALDDIGDITKYSPAELLTYNMTDAVATWHVYDLYHEVIVQTQKSVYEELFLPTLKTITQMELCGMPLNLGKVLVTEQILDDIYRSHYQAIMGNDIVIGFNDVLRDKKAELANKKLKKLRKTRDDFLDVGFNPGSPNQLAFLLYKHLKLPVLGTTDTGQPATGGKILKALIEQIKGSKKFNQTYIELLQHIVELGEASKILTTFIPAFKNNTITKEGWEYLHGSFNLGGTKSGRLSSSDPNLTNIPSTGTQYAQPIKECFQVPPHTTPEDPNGWLMVGADFEALEDKVSALQTKDPNKLKIYTDGYDGHCLRAYSYFGDKMQNIQSDNVQSINSIAQKYPDLRQNSKSPTFLLTYMGTYHGLMKQFGFSLAVARRIEKNYHDLYAVSDQWVMDRIHEAGRTGYVELAFGLKLRTPMLPKVIIDSDSMPYQAHKEIKTAGNALGQSYGLLNSRAANEFMQRVWQSKYATRILPICQIHDSQYYMIENTLGCLQWVNNNLIECMQWNELEAIQHPTIKLTAKMEVYYPDWAHPIPIPNQVSLQELKAILRTI